MSQSLAPKSVRSLELLPGPVATIAFFRSLAHERPAWWTALRASLATNPDLDEPAGAAGRQVIV